MKARINNGVLTLMEELPQNLKTEDSHIFGLRNLSSTALEALGFFDVVDDSYNSLTQALSEPVFDEEARVYRRVAVNLLLDVELLKEGLLETVKREAGNRLQPTDWQVTRFAETGTPVDPVVLSERQGIRNRCNAIEAEIAALLTAEELLTYDLVF